MAALIPLVEAGDAEAGDPMAEVAAIIDSRIARFVEWELGRWVEVHPELHVPISSLGRLLAGGKRLRPLFTYAAFIGAGGAAHDLLYDVCAGLELMHAAALIHDDVMDRGSTRRGRPSQHTGFAALHSDRGWRGNPERYGDNVAILVGDLAMFYARQLLAAAPREARDVFEEAGVEASMGQYLDLLETARRRCDRDGARTAALYKSGKYSVERPLHLGAALCGRLEDLSRPLSAIGLPLGEAFQLRDDLLGAFGEPRVTGKPVGEDLRAGKCTLLLAIACERADPSESALLAKVGTDELSDAHVSQLQEILVSTGARREVELVCEELMGQAVAAIAEAPIEDAGRHCIEGLAEYVVRRWA
jgi:geranylgeranyl diphosphate synthase type I